MHRVTQLILLVAALNGLALIGCAPDLAAPTSQPSMLVMHPAVASAAPATRSSVAATRPYLLHLPGIGGERVVDQWLVSGLSDGGVNAETEIFDWTENEPGLPALHAYDRNRERARLVADKIEKHFRAEPNRPIYLTCHSGGAGLMVWALEDLPDDVHVEKLVFIAPALSTKYDLTAALRHVHGQAYSFNSLLDSMVLKTGTKLFGTIDGIKSEAAGYSGFVRPPGGDEAQYAKLIQCNYESEWLQYGNMGTHIGAMTQGFAKAIIAPIMLDSGTAVARTLVQGLRSTTQP